jgi:hypothetical protein
MNLSPFVRLIELLDSLQDVHTEFFENKLQRYRVELLSREWVRVAGYSSFHMADFFGDEVEVEIEIDETAEVYRYQNPQRRRHTVVAPLWEVTHYNVCIDKWLDDLSDFIGIEPSRKSIKREQLAGHLWHLGEVRVGSTHRFAQVYIARRSQDQIRDQIKAVLDDKVDPGNGILFVDKVSNPKLFGEHIERCLADLVEFDGNQSTFNRQALDRILMRYASIRAENTPDEYFDGNLLKLAHIAQPLKLTDEQFKIVSQMWGSPDKNPPVRPWAEANEAAKTGYQSFEDAFGSAAKRDLVFQRVGRGKYRIRRGAIQKTIKETINGAINRP